MPASAKVTAAPGSRVFRLDGSGVSYALGVDDKGYLRPIHWGAPLPDGDPLVPPPVAEPSSFDPAPSVTAQEFPGQGEGLVTEPGVKVAFADGNRDLVLKYRSHRVDGETLIVELADIVQPFFVTLRYTIDPDTGILARSATIRNGGKRPMRVDQLAAAVFTLPSGDDYRLSYLTGRHAAEWTLKETPVTPALTAIESRRGLTGHGNNPWFAIGRNGKTAEESGPVWFGALAWSGSFRISVAQDVLGRVRVGAGYNPYDFAWRLKPGETLDTPVFYAGYSDHGMGGASRTFHDFQMAHILPDHARAKLRPVLYNSWEATAFDVTEAGQMALAEKAAKIGAERFVVDDGWFGARDSNRAGLGDWTVNPRKFPNGLKPLIDKVKSLGMDFGLWVEPESVNPDSDLYRKHPDWVVSFPGRPRTEARNQLVLNLARQDVRDHVLAWLDRLVTENDIAFLKWDVNRRWTEPGWAEQAPEDQQRLYVDYVRNLYSILDTLRRRHPALEIEGCAGGGGRVDLGMMARVDEVWTSDNTDPSDRLAIQDGFTRAYAPATMMAWVTDSPNWANTRVTTLDYRFLSAMQGGLGIGANLIKWQAEDFATASKWIAAYKGIRPTVQRGRLYRLISPDASASTSATMYVARDQRQAVLFQMLHSSMWRDNPGAILPLGLAAERRYSVRMLGGTPLPAGVPAVASGQYWMTQGIRAPLKGDFVGAAFVFEAAP
ncbi:alpha-galactosidase [Sphingomonas ginsenosidivorax]|uniref:Alpha-galactosidase n=2 Tax=Sphingomonas ginsenosidivorax TaxID=862135 RepID=A0A5C6UJV8_9SPHN|nr:alpha-galactosidase [Sphingomonas ginsenosidivorax]